MDSLLIIYFKKKPGSKPGYKIVKLLFYLTPVITVPSVLATAVPTPVPIGL